MILISLLVKSSLITWLRWCSTSLLCKSTIFPFVINKWFVGEILYDYVSIMLIVKLPLTSFGIHWRSSGSILLSIFISWHLIIRKSFSFSTFMYVYLYGFMNTYLIQWIIIYCSHYLFSFSIVQDLAHGNPFKLASFWHKSLNTFFTFRSEERRVEKECRSRWSPYH